MDILTSITKKKVRLTFVDEVLGTCSSDPELHDNYIASKAPDALSREEEVALLGVGDVVEKGMTVFMRNAKGNPIVLDYWVRGYIKAALKNIKKGWPKSECAKVKANKQTVDNQIFVTPRQVEIIMPEHGVVGDCQRPLRAETAQGPRVALAHSESIPEGSSIEFTLKLAPEICKGVDKDEVFREIFNYGCMNGMGQWHNSGKGRFYYEFLDADGNVTETNREEVMEMLDRENEKE